MIRLLSRFHFVFFMMIFPALAVCYAQTNTKDTPATPAKALDPALIDSSVDPCVNFYQYSCGNWLKKNPIPEDRSSYGRDTELLDQNFLVLKSILEKAAAGNTGRSAEEQKIGDYYATCMDADAIDKAGLVPLKPLLGRVDALSSKDGLPELAAALQLEGVGSFFSFSSDQDFKDASQQIGVLDQAELGLPEKGYYSRTDAQSVQLREQYQKHVERTFELIGESHAQAEKDAATVLRLETALAAASLNNVERRDPARLYHKLELAKFDAGVPNFAFDRFLRAANTPPIQSLNVATPGYFAALNQLLGSTGLADLKTYLRWSMLRRTPATALPRDLDEESFAFYGKILSGQPQQQPRWKRCVRSVDGALGEALGQAYVAQRFSPEDKARTLELTKDIEDAMNRDIDQLVWMSPQTKVKAKEKLHGVANKIGYPDKWRDYTTLEVKAGDALGNAQRAAAFEARRDIAKIGKPVDHGEWGMSPPTVNAYYNPQMNDINFPAGILQPPYFDPTQNDAVNYGDVGGVIGHELTHGFDDEGRQFDAHGNFVDWWTPADSKQFSERSSCVVKEFDGFVAVDNLHVNGQLTLGENLADLGGLKLAFLAYLDRAQKAGVSLTQKGSAEYGNLTPEQQFFVSYGQGWCQNNRPADLRLRVQTDPHSPEEFRVNGVVVNVPQFQKAFGCKTGQPMAPANRCEVW
ncbi:endothelin-converting enzyme/putative endopeptidase [Silvibacterium bohemicum]|uniref:Endothelin-converting enzyme/putative endopeptidase n=1 Tax=Silvibacterium bohemicum TaxID=1577686 RepID=A0A841JTF2_9BACT|nr:M13 family metallopeptidase [Silvibacterium bohemicum]MBB6144606.1 endothelin-converting enzyme/putative endopeptidase [Silvibacterium bohemicum]